MIRPRDDTNGGKAMEKVRKVVLATVVFCALFSLGAAILAAAEEKINVNQAGQAEFYALPGMTETLAKAIVSYRANVGRFDKLDDLLKVPGMTKEYLGSISSSIVIVPEEDEVKLPRY
jgi:competence ComEA-like helix-hairpin-helix protein